MDLCGDGSHRCSAPGNHAEPESGGDHLRQACDDDSPVWRLRCQGRPIREGSIDVVLDECETPPFRDRHDRAPAFRTHDSAYRVLQQRHDDCDAGMCCARRAIKRVGQDSFMIHTDTDRT